MDGLTDLIVRFRDERDWEQFHTPDNLARALAVEAAELLECFQWGRPMDWHTTVEEVADVLIYALLMCRSLGIAPDAAVIAKLDKNASKYPADEWRGRAWR